MSYLKILKEGSLWWVMLGFVLGNFMGHEMVFEQIGTDWASFYEMPWHPLLVKMLVLASEQLVIILVIATILLIADTVRVTRELIGIILKKVWNNVKKR